MHPAPRVCTLVFFIILYMLQRCLKEIVSGADVVLSTLTGASPEGSLRYCSYHEHYDYDSVCLD